MGVDYSDVVKLAADLHAAAPAIVPRATRVVSTTGRDTVAGGQALVPIETSALHDSITVTFDDDGLGFVAGPEAHYGGYVEDGDFNTGPQPYMGPSFDDNVDEAERALGDAGEDVLT
jgi:hypothetical protein